MDREAATNVSAIEQVDRAVAMFARYYRYERIEGMERVQTDRIPLEAFREAVANALLRIGRGTFERTFKLPCTMIVSL